MKQMTGEVKTYGWGSRTAIPAILGTQETGQPQAEYWLGAHPAGPSMVDGVPLNIELKAHPDELGAASRAQFGDQLPFLLKILAAEQPLSLQAHPSREQAEAGFARENDADVPLDHPKRTYKDRWPKPELLVALTEFDGLCGFRDPAQTADLFAQLDPSEELTDLLAPLTQRCTTAGLAEVFLAVLSMGPDRRHVVTELVAKAVTKLNSHGPLGRFAKTAIELDEFYPGDPSIIAALLCNRVTLQPGEALYLPARNMHAYLKGTGIEVMANSDNVLRGGLTHKHIDVDQLVSVLTFEPDVPSVIYPTGEAPGLSRYRTPAPEFALWRLDLTPGLTVAMPADDRARVLLVIEGSLDCVGSGDQRPLSLVKGQSAFFAAGESVRASGECSAFLAAAGV